eukprot:4063738-Amphidinium_carterae.1
MNTPGFSISFSSVWVDFSTPEGVVLVCADIEYAARINHRSGCSYKFIGFCDGQSFRQEQHTNTASDGGVTWNNK